MCELLRKEGHEEEIRRRTGLKIDPYFSGTKVRWFLDEVPGLRAKAEAGKVLFGTVDSWLIYRLTGGRVHVTDYSNASRTLLYNIRDLEWDDEILRILDLPRAILPEVVPSSGVVGETDPDILLRYAPPPRAEPSFSMNTQSERDVALSSMYAPPPLKVPRFRMKTQSSICGLARLMNMPPASSPSQLVMVKPRRMASGGSPVKAKLNARPMPWH